MRSKVLAAALAVGVLGLPVASAAAPSTANTRPVGQAVDPLQFDAALRASLREGHDGPISCNRRLDTLLAAAARPEFDRLPTATRRLALRLAAGCLDGPRDEEAIALVRRLEPLADSPQLLAAANAALLREDVEAGRWAGAGRRMIVIIDNDPSRVARWWPPYIRPVVEGLYETPDVQRQLLRRLVAMDWQDAGSAAMARNGWALAYADHLIAAGDRAGAEKVLARADETAILAAIAQERMYDWLWPGYAAKGRLDWAALARAEAAASIADMEASPTHLPAAYEAQLLLRRFGRYDEAVAIGRKLRAQLKTGKFQNREIATQVLWELGLSLLDKGEVEEAEAVFQEAIAEGDAGDDPVAARLNWAEALNSLGRHEEALKVLDAIPPESHPNGPTPYGAMRIAGERVCALAALGRPAWTPLASMVLRQAENPAALQKALLCLNQLDEAAALYVQRLSEPGPRPLALAAFRRSPPPPAVTPYFAELNRRRQVVQARPEVRKALDAAGRSIEVPFPWRHGGWF